MDKTILALRSLGPRDKGSRTVGGIPNPKRDPEAALGVSGAMGDSAVASKQQD